MFVGIVAVARNDFLLEGAGYKHAKLLTYVMCPFIILIIQNAHTVTHLPSKVSTTLHHKHPSQLHITLLTTWTYPTVSINGKGKGKGPYT